MHSPFMQKAINPFFFNYSFHGGLWPEGRDKTTDSAKVLIGWAKTVNSAKMGTPETLSDSLLRAGK